MSPSATVAPEDDPTYQEVFSSPCDICHYLKITRNKQVKWVHWNEEGEDHSIILCSPCQTGFEKTEGPTKKEKIVTEKSETPEEPPKEIAEVVTKRCVNRAKETGKPRNEIA
jgi:hypothetical protein